MRTVTRVCGLVVAGILSASSVLAQGMGSAKHEFGVDLAIMSSKVDGADARVLQIGTPVDVRIGFVTSGKLMFEPRFTFSYESSDGSSTMSFDPGLNLLWRLGSSHQSGAYLTAGGNLSMERFSPDGGETESETRTGFNVGIGTRKQWGMAALRPEVFYSMLMEKDASPAVSAFGIRIGLSFWH